MRIAPRPGHILTREAFYHVAIVVALLIAALALYRTLGQPLGTAPLTGAPVSVVPATGAEGYPIAAFACDDRTSVKLSIPPPDSTFKVTYDLNRRVDGVHEAATVSVYADGAAFGRHYDSANTPSDGNVSEKALKCLRDKAR